MPIDSPLLGRLRVEDFEEEAKTGFSYQEAKDQKGLCREESLASELLERTLLLFQGANILTIFFPQRTSGTRQEGNP